MEFKNILKNIKEYFNPKYFEKDFNFSSNCSIIEDARLTRLKKDLGGYLNKKGFEKISEQQGEGSRFVFYRHPDKYCIEMEIDKYSPKGSFLIRAKDKNAKKVFNWNEFSLFIIYGDKSKK